MSIIFIIMVTAVVVVGVNVFGPCRCSECDRRFPTLRAFLAHRDVGEEDGEDRCLSEQETLQRGKK